MEKRRPRFIGLNSLFSESIAQQHAQGCIFLDFPNAIGADCDRQNASGWGPGVPTFACLIFGPPRHRCDSCDQFSRPPSQVGSKLKCSCCTVSLTRRGAVRSGTNAALALQAGCRAEDLRASTSDNCSCGDGGAAASSISARGATQHPFAPLDPGCMITCSHHRVKIALAVPGLVRWYLQQNHPSTKVAVHPKKKSFLKRKFQKQNLAAGRRRRDANIVTTLIFLDAPHIVHFVSVASERVKHILKRWNITFKHPR